MTSISRCRFIIEVALDAPNLVDVCAPVLVYGVVYALLSSQSAPPDRGYAGTAVNRATPRQTTPQPRRRRRNIAPSPPLDSPQLFPNHIRGISGVQLLLRQMSRSPEARDTETPREATTEVGKRRNSAERTDRRSFWKSDNEKQ